MKVSCSGCHGTSTGSDYARSIAIGLIGSVHLHDGEDGGVVARPLDGVVVEYFGGSTAQETAVVYIVYAVLPTGRVARGPGAAGMSQRVGMGVAVGVGEAGVGHRLAHGPVDDQIAVQGTGCGRPIEVGRAVEVAGDDDGAVGIS